MKIVRVDNLGRESHFGDERFVASELSEEDAKKVLEIYRTSSSRPHGDWYRIVGDDHILREFRP